MNEFYISLPSNTRKTNQSDSENTTSHYRVQLPRDIRLEGDWEVALVEIQYPYSWNNVPKRPEKNGLKSNQIQLVLGGENNVWTDYYMNVFPGNYDNMDHIMAGLYEAKNSVIPEQYKNNIGFGYDGVKRRVKITCKNSAMHLSEHLQYVLGFTQRKIAKSTEADYAPDLRGGIDSLYVYCDLCEPQIVGDTMEPLLRILPVTGEYGSIVHTVFVAPHYVGLLNKDFSSVEISIKTDRNEYVDFSFGKTVAKLHFRRKRRYQI